MPKTPNPKRRTGQVSGEEFKFPKMEFVPETRWYMFLAAKVFGREMVWIKVSKPVLVSEATEA